MLELIIGVFITFFTTLLRTFIARRIGHVGRDIHKKDRRMIPESAGVGMRIGSLYVMRALKDLYPGIERFALTIFLVGLVGLIDDFVELGPKTKPLLTFLAGIPALKASPYYIDTLLGKVRAESLMKVAVPAGYAVYANATNMIDSMNTVAVFGTAMILAYQTVLLKLMNNDYYLLALAFLLIVLAYLPFNLYPAHAFNGDVGDFVMGSMVFTVALCGGIILPTLVVSIPIITNGRAFVSSVGLKTRKEAPPLVEIDEKTYKMRANPLVKGRPATLVWLMVSTSGEASETDIIRYYVFFFLFSLLLGIIVGVFYV